MIKIIILVVIVAIVISLGSALFAMMTGGNDNKEKSEQMFKALVWRIGLSIVLFILLLLAYSLGLIEPLRPNL